MCCSKNLAQTGNP
ncbi:hypothetical protein F383_03756 [Gossypium arboreum]|uniref:Uncharacterized protein n=1 Tax=Gossypium arboreum TaxID=29729 RepID=A0A0B0NTT1_GOSAR|nr:hypothetical protein F383_03756 [Gossypium arboreum]